MAKTFRLPKEEPLLNIASYARGGPRAADRLTPWQIEQIRLTVNRAPEAVVKVLPRSSNDLKAVGKHIDYIGRRGNLELESPPKSLRNANATSQRWLRQARCRG